MKCYIKSSSSDVRAQLYDIVQSLQGLIQQNFPELQFRKNREYEIYSYSKLLYLNLTKGLCIAVCYDPEIHTKHQDQEVIIITEGIEPYIIQVARQSSDLISDMNDPAQLFALISPYLQQFVDTKIKRGSGKKSAKASKFNNMQENLIALCEDVHNPLYEYVDEPCVMYFEGMEADAEAALGVWSEGSVQGGMGEICIYDSTDDHILARVDYDYWCESLLEIYYTSKGKAEVTRRCKAFIEDVIAENSSEAL